MSEASSLSYVASRAEMLRVTGIDCAVTLEQAIGRQKSVRSASVSFVAETARLTVDPATFSPSAVVSEVRNHGYDVASSSHENRGTRLRFQLTGLGSADCARTVQSNVSALPGVVEVDVNFSSATLVVRPDSPLDPSRIVQDAEESGYGARLIGDGD